MPQKLIRLPEVTARTGLRRSAIYARLTRNPHRPNDYDATFPRPVRVGLRAVAWVESEVDAWIESRIACDRGAHAVETGEPASRIRAGKARTHQSVEAA